jgi:hypothetical protein
VKASAGVTATPLDEAATRQLLARLSPLPDVDAANAHAPTVRAPSLPPPRSGPGQPITFAVTTGNRRGRPVATGDNPPGNAPSAPAQAKSIYPLAPPEILPDGEVRAEAVIRVRFTEPMIPVAKVGDAPLPPATISPAVPGRWRWLDTRVLEFETSQPWLPQATTYTITVAAGVTAVSGAKLAAAAVGTFTTPPIALDHPYPRELRPDGAIALAFDQPFDAANIARFVKITTPRGTAIPFQVIDRAAAEARWGKDPSILKGPSSRRRSARTACSSRPRRHGLRGSRRRSTLGTGAPVGRGPAGVRRDLERGVRRRPRVPGPRLPLRVGRPPAHDEHVPCQQLGQRRVLEHESKRSRIARTWSSSKACRSPTTFRARTRWGSARRWPSGARSRSGSLATACSTPTVSRWSMRRARRSQTTPQVFTPYFEVDDGLLVLDPRFDIPQWVIHAQAMSGVHVQLYRVTPADYFAYEEFEAGTRKTPPGTRVFDQVYTIGPRSGATLRVDLRPALSSRGSVTWSRSRRRRA